MPEWDSLEQVNRRHAADHDQIPGQLLLCIFGMRVTLAAVPYPNLDRRERFDTAPSAAVSIGRTVLYEQIKSGAFVARSLGGAR